MIVQQREEIICNIGGGDFANDFSRFGKGKSGAGLDIGFAGSRFRIAEAVEF